MSRSRPSAVRRAARALGACVLVAGLVGCSGGASEPDAVAPSPVQAPAPAEPEPLATRVMIERVEGDLSADVRERLRGRVGTVLDTWIDGAYGGDYPRKDFSGAFAAFTDGARDRAEGDRALMSNAAVGDALDDVVPVRRLVRLDVLAVRGAAVGVTARVDVLLDLGEPSAERRERVWGSLFLTRANVRGTTDWRVFGYDLRRREV